MTNLNAALGCAQLEQILDFIDSKRRLFESYQESFRNLKQVSLFKEPDNSKVNYWLQTLFLDESVKDQKKEILEITNSVGLMTRPVWTLLHKLEPYKDMPRSPLRVAESIENKIINLPSSAGIL